MMIFNTLVLSGGSYKGYSYLGLLKRLEEMGVREGIRNVSCCSVGSIFGLFFTLGLSSSEMLRLLTEYDITRAYHFDINAFLSGYGFCDFSKIRDIMSDILEKKGFNPNITFQELHQKTKIHYVVNATCLETRSGHYFSHVEAPNLEVLTAVQMSCAIPLLFVCVKHEGKTFVDGGLLDNLPVNYFSSKPRDEILSVYLTETVTTPKIDSLGDFVFNLINMVTSNYNKIREKLYYPDHYLIKICVPINFMTLELDRNTIDSLIESGYQQTSYYFALWKVKYGFTLAKPESKPDVSKPDVNEPNKFKIRLRLKSNVN